MPRQKPKADPERQLMIKTKACQRLIKEAAYYEKEVNENDAKLEKMKTDGRDPYDIKKFEEVLGESQMMVPDSLARMTKNLEELSDYLTTHAEELKPEGEFVGTAKSLLEKHLLLAGDSGNVQETNVDDLKEDEVF